MPKKLQTVVLVGRPNVGKSTLFNRITGVRHAIVARIAGTTRDVNSHHAEWAGVRFTLTDTGGMFGASEDPLHDLVAARGRKALEDPSVVVFVADAVGGALPADQEVAEALRASGKPVVLAVNKADDRRAQAGPSASWKAFGQRPEPPLHRAPRLPRGEAPARSIWVRR